MPTTFPDHDDAAYAADAEGPSPAASPTPAVASPSSRRQQSIKNREFGLYASRLRHLNPSMKHDVAANGPLALEEQPHQIMAKTRTRTRTRNRASASASEDDPGSNRSSSTAAAAGGSGVRTFTLKSPRSRAFHDRSPAAENFDNYDDDDDDDDNNNDDDNDNDEYQNQDRDDGYEADVFSARPQPRTLSPTFTVSPISSPISSHSSISPRWASLAHSPTVLYEHTTTTTTTTTTTSSSIGQPTSAATSPRSSTPKAFRSSSTAGSNAGSNAGSRPQSPSSLNRFLGLTSHPFVAESPTPDRSSASTVDFPLTAGGQRRHNNNNHQPNKQPPLAVSGSVAALRTQPSASELPSPTNSLASETMLVGNFSRPRMASISRGSRDVVPSPISLQSQPTWPQERTRGLSGSSNKSAASTFSSLPNRPSNDHLHGIRHVVPLQQATSMISPGLPRPQAAYSRNDGLGSTNANSSSNHNIHNNHNNYNNHGNYNNHNDHNNNSHHHHQQPYHHQNNAYAASGAGSNAQAREPLPWIADETLRSSYRSQLTASTAQGTLFTATGTERSSVVTKMSSRTSISWYANAAASGDDGLSVEDVMGMYEKGFADSTGAEDNAKDSGDDGMTDCEGLNGLNSVTRPVGAANSGTTVRSRFADDITLPHPSGLSTMEMGITADEGPHIVRDSGSFFRNSGLSLSAPNDVGLGLAGQNANARNASARKAGKPDGRPDGQHDKNDMGDKGSKDDKESKSKDDKHGTGQDAEREKRDSAKMLERDDRSKAQSPPVAGLVADTTDSRPGSSKSASIFRSAPSAEAEDPNARDRYGFRKHNQYITREQYDSWNGPYSEYINRRRKKWVTYLKDSGLMTEKPNRFPPPSVKTKRFIRKGIPPEWRGAAWFYYAGGPSIVAKHPGIYDYLVRRVAAGEAKEVDIEAIERDLHRTFPDNIAFQFADGQQPGHGDNRDVDADGKPSGDVTADRAEEPKIVSKLRRVLLAFSVYNPRIGYCQSLNFLAGLLLLFVETEEQCFWLLNVITRIYLPGTHEMSLEGSKVDLSVLMTALQDSLPNVWAKIGGELDEGVGHQGGGRHHHQGAHLHDAARHGGVGGGALGLRMKLPMLGGGRGGDAAAAAAAAAASSSADRLPPITLCMTAWFMSCFIGTLPMETTLRVWDIFFYEGSKTLFRVALAVFKLGESEIRAVSDPMEMFGVVQAFPRRLLDCNMVMEATFRRRNGFGHLSQENIEEKRREQRDVLKEARKPSTADGRDGGSATSSREATTAMTNKNTLVDRQHGAGRHQIAGLDAHDELGQDVHRKGTLFGRRRERRPMAEVM